MKSAALCSLLMASSALVASGSTLMNLEDHLMKSVQDVYERAQFSQDKQQRQKSVATASAPRQIAESLIKNDVKMKADRTIRAAASTQYVTFRQYNSTEDCDGNTMLQGTYGIGICISATATKYPTAQSSQYQYDDSIVTQDFYSSTDCSGDPVASQVAANFTGYDSDTCSDGLNGYKVEWSEDGSFSVPNQDGALIGEYATSSCSDPFFAAWAMNAALDFTFGFDDLELANLATCTAETINIDDYDDYYYSDDSFGYTANAYFQFETTQEDDSSSGKKNKCFLGSETVELASGDIVPISSVKVGDSIVAADRNGKTVVSEVIAVPHGNNMVSSVFVNLVTASGKDISLTPDHLLMVNSGCNAADVTDLRAAREVSVGMCLMSTSGLEKVSSVSEITARGIYTLVTKDEMLVVNGFVASPFAGNHAVLNAYYNVIRSVPMLMQMPLMKQANMIFGSLVEAFTN